MSESAFDHAPAEQKLRVCGQKLADGEEEIANACAGLLLYLSDPWELAGASYTPFFEQNYDGAPRAALCKRAARAAMAVLLADRGMRLPEHIELFFSMPEPPAIEFQRLLRHMRAQTAALETLTRELQQQRKPAVRDLIDLARLAAGELNSVAGDRELAVKLQNAINEAAA
jgi:hypothetical protein